MEISGELVIRLKNVYNLDNFYYYICKLIFRFEFDISSKFKIILNLS